MTKIIINEPERPYKAVIDTGAMEVELKETYIGVHFLTSEGARLSVSERDGGFEVKYAGDFGQTGFNAGTTTFKDGKVDLPT